jgi:hypothetical protein
MIYIRQVDIVMVLRIGGKDMDKDQRSEESRIKTTALAV